MIRAGRNRCITARVALWLAAALLPALLLAAPPAAAGTDSARFRFEGNKWLSLGLTVDDVRADTIRFQWPATVLGMQTGYKADVKVVNESTRQARIGLGVALYDEAGKLIGAGTTGTKLGTIDPGDSAEFSVDFNHVTARLEEAAQFHIVLETR